MPVTSRVWVFVALALGLTAGASEGARVELYTVGLGDDLFNKFGHAALCVVDDDVPGGGLCYNYGTSDFSRPIGLAWDVVRGHAKFWVSVSDLFSMILWFQGQDRTIYRQVFPLSDAQVETLRIELAEDATPENREYIYSHFLDNCSTRPRDWIDEITGGELRKTRIESPLTYRDYAREGFASFHWSLVPAGDLILGRWVDQDIGAYEAMFIPRVLRRAVEERFGARPTLVYERQAPLAAGDVRGALVRFWVVVIGLSLFAWISRPGARLAVAVVVLMAVIVWAGALLSPWPELRVNELALVFLPSDVLLSRKPVYAKIRLGMLGGIALLAASGIFVQPIWPYWTLATATAGACWWRTRRH